MEYLDWVKELPVAITICDTEGKILYMNNKALQTFDDDGGEKLLGKNLFDCHPEPSKTKLKQMFKDKSPNTYSKINGNVKKIIHQVPWFSNNEYKGFVEMSFEIPLDNSDL